MLPTAACIISLTEDMKIFFDFEQVTWLTIVYKTLYATADKVFVPMAHNCTTEARIITDVVLS